MIGLAGTGDLSPGSDRRSRQTMLQVKVMARGRLAKNSRIQTDGTVIALPEGGRVRDLLAEVGVFDEEVREVIINGRRGRLDQALHRDDSVVLRS